MELTMDRDYIAFVVDQIIKESMNLGEKHVQVKDNRAYVYDVEYQSDSYEAKQLHSERQKRLESEYRTIENKIRDLKEKLLKHIS